MSSRNDILTRVRDAAPSGIDHPGAYAPKFEGDAIELFEQRLVASGGEMVTLSTEAELRDVIAQRWPDLAERKVWSGAPDTVATQFPEASSTLPVELQRLDLAILRGAECVAENAAVWVTAEAMPHRSLLFLAEHLVLLVRRDQLVHTMHEAYARLSQRGDHSGYFVAGPSKTSDIAQCLVIGAQGPRSCLVCMVEDSD